MKRVGFYSELSPCVKPMSLPRREQASSASICIYYKISRSKRSIIMSIPRPKCSALIGQIGRIETSSRRAFNRKVKHGLPKAATSDTSLLEMETNTKFPSVQRRAIPYRQSCYKPSESCKLTKSAMNRINEKEQHSKKRHVVVNRFQYPLTDPHLVKLRVKATLLAYSSSIVASCRRHIATGTKSWRHLLLFADPGISKPSFPRQLLTASSRCFLFCCIPYQ